MTRLEQEIKPFIRINDLSQSARYSSVFDDMLESESGIKEVLKISYESDYQGFVDADVLLNNGRVCSYRYSYGSCSGCDEWEDRGLSDEEIVTTMKTEATWFDSIDEYKKFDRLKDNGITE